MKTTYITIAIVSLLALGTVIYGFTLTGSPFSARAIQMDSTRVSNITSLKYSVESYYRSKSKLPATLADLSESSYKYSYGSTDITKDPETGKSYDYKVKGTTSYQLCATFSTDSSATSKNSSYKYGYSYDSSEFKHPKGYHCFDLKVTNYSSSYYTPTKTSTIEDSRIDTVTSNYTGTNTGNFPYGFFSSNSNEWGLQTYTTKPITVTIKFKSAEKISSISNTFTTCTTDNCYSWSATGVSGGKTVSLVSTTATSAVGESKQTVTSTKAFSSITITAERTSGSSFLYWKKIKLGYS